jgi:hypothetical protein
MGARFSHQEMHAGGDAPAIEVHAQRTTAAAPRAAVQRRVDYSALPVLDHDVCDASFVVSLSAVCCE